MRRTSSVQRNTHWPARRHIPASAAGTVDGQTGSPSANPRREPWAPRNRTQPRPSTYSLRTRRPVYYPGPARLTDCLRCGVGCARRVGSVQVAKRIFSSPLLLTHPQIAVFSLFLFTSSHSFRTRTHTRKQHNTMKFSLAPLALLALAGVALAQESSQSTSSTSAGAVTSSSSSSSVSSSSSSSSAASSSPAPSSAAGGSSSGSNCALLPGYDQGNPLATQYGCTQNASTSTPVYDSTKLQVRGVC